MRVRNLDALKWIGAAAMLVDHLWLYVFGPTIASEAVGSLAFPLFAIALAFGVSSQHYGSRVRTLQRLVLGAIAAQLALLTVRDFLPLNVIFTLAAGVALDTAWRYELPRAQRFALVAGAIAVGVDAEYLHFGALFVAALCWWARTQSDRALVASLVLLVVVAPLNANWWALAAPAVVAVVGLLPRDTPRVRDAFYYVYVMQWPLIAATASLLTAWGRT